MSILIDEKLELIFKIHTNLPKIESSVYIQNSCWYRYL